MEVLTVGAASSSLTCAVGNRFTRHGNCTTRGGVRKTTPRVVCDVNNARTDPQRAVAERIGEAIKFVRKQFVFALGPAPAGLPALPQLRGVSVVASVLASFSSARAALALNYEDIVNQVKDASSAATSAASDVSSGIDFDGANGAVEFLSGNPLAVLAGIAAVAVPLVASRAIANPQAFGSVSAVDAYTKLSDTQENAQILDIRSPEDIKVEGAPDLKSLRKRVVQIPYKSDEEGFSTKVISKFKDAENITLYILDGSDGSSSAVAKLLANSGFKAAYAIRGGAEGNNGWKKNELPWSLPKKGFSLDISSLKNVIGDGPSVSVDTSTFATTTLGVAAAAGVGLVIFSEAEAVLQLVGSAALVQLLVKKFLFGEDRKKTISEIQSFWDTKIAPKEFVEEMKEVGWAILPKDKEVSSVVANGAAFLEEKLEVDSVTPGALLEKAEEKVEEQLGVKIPSPQDVASKVEAELGVEIPSPQEAASKVEAALPSVEQAAPSVESEKLSAEPVTSSTDGTLASAMSAFEGDEPSAFQEIGVGQDIGASKDVESQPSVSASSSSTDLPQSPTPLSPYTKYPGLKPPTSPIPSRP